MFIVFEGLDCSGKTTNLQHFDAYCRDAGIDTVVTREPGGTLFNEELRTLLKTKSHGIEKLTEIMLFYAGRIESVEKVVKANTDKIVLSDRCFETTFAYQGALGDDALTNKIQQIHDVCLGDFKPDLTLLFDVSPQTFLRRKAIARQAEIDVFEERGIQYFTRVREIYLSRAVNNPNCIILDAEQPLELVTAQIQIIAQNVISRLNYGIKS